MKSYKSLRTVASFFKALAYVSVVIGLIFSALFLASQAGNPIGLLMGIGQAVLSLIAFVLLLALSEFIMLGINVADDISTIATNAYAIAQKTTERKIDDDEL